MVSLSAVPTGTTPLPARRRWVDRPTAVAMAVVGLAAVAISAAGSWIPSLWGDEAASLLSARRPLGSLLAMFTHVDAVHGVYYLFLKVWIHLFGTSPFAIRFPSAIAAGLCAAGMVYLARRLGSLRFAILAGSIAAVLPRITFAGEEARAYAMDAVVATALWIIVAEIALRGPRRGLWIAYAVTLCVGIYLFFYFVLFIAATGVFLLVTPALRGQLRPWLRSSAIAVLVASPLVVTALIEHNQVAFLAHRAVITPDNVLVVMWFDQPLFAVVGWILIAIAVAGLLLDLRRRIPAGAVRPETLALCWLLIPVGILLAVSPVIAAYSPRYGTFSAPAAALLIALGIRRLRRVKAATAVAAVLVVAAAASTWAAERTPYAKNQSDWNDIAATIHSHAVSGDAIVFDEGTLPSRRPRLAMDTNPAAFAGLTDPTLQTRYTRSKTWYSHARSVTQAADRGRFDGVERVWVVEYKIDGKVDSWGVDDLRRLGFSTNSRFDGHSSVILLMTR